MVGWGVRVRAWLECLWFQLGCTTLGRSSGSQLCVAAVPLSRCPLVRPSRQTILLLPVTAMKLLRLSELDSLRMKGNFAVDTFCAEALDPCPLVGCPLVQCPTRLRPVLFDRFSFSVGSISRHRCRTSSAWRCCAPVFLRDVGMVGRLQRQSRTAGVCLRACCVSAVTLGLISCRCSSD